jgi:hypothetical protein
VLCRQQMQRTELFGEGGAICEVVNPGKPGFTIGVLTNDSVVKPTCVSVLKLGDALHIYKYVLIFGKCLCNSG